MKYHRLFTFYCKQDALSQAIEELIINDCMAHILQGVKEATHG